MSRPWSAEDSSYRPPLGTVPRQPSTGVASAGFGQGFGGQVQGIGAQQYVGSGSAPGQLNGNPSNTHQQFMPTHYSQGVVVGGAPQSGLTLRTPSSGVNTSNLHQQQVFQPMASTAPVFMQPTGATQNDVDTRVGAPQSPSLSGNAGCGAASPSPRFGYPEDDLPLLEELGINPSHIKAKAIAVLHPLGRMREEAISDPDLAGPFVFAILLGFLLSLQGKVQFSAIYGLSSLGMFGFRILIGLMSDDDVRILHIVSTLGYCLLPNLVLAVVQTVLWWATGSHKLALPFAAVTISWSAWCACQMFAKLFGMESQRFLLLYPLAVFYSVFAALTIF